MTQVGMTYKDAGVDIDAKSTAIQQFKRRAARTLGADAGPIGHFGGTYRIPAGPDQILVASADGAGTKLRLAFVRGGDAHAGMGRDLVNHCANDVLALGARPLFFLDYLATGNLDVDVATAIVGGVADACLENGIALLGGETAEMPDMYAAGEYDLAGFIVGTVDPDRIIDGSAISPGDVVFGLPSNGLHTNGYSLARRILRLTGEITNDRATLAAPLPGSGLDLGTALLAPHIPYERTMRPLIDSGVVRGMAHITGGGLVDNLPRTLPESCVAQLDRSSWDVPPIFDHLVERGGVSMQERHHVFNMGIGFVLIVHPTDRDAVLAEVAESWEIGSIAFRQSPDEPAVQGLDR